MSAFQLLSSPLITSVLFILKTGGLEEAKKSKKSEVAGIGFFAFLAYVVFFLPIMTLEIIHFFPVLFEYYMYKGISYQDLVIYLLLFNIPKVLFIGIKWSDFEGAETGTTAAGIFAEAVVRLSTLHNTQWQQLKWHKRLNPSKI